jgi:hypothetical protein
MARPEAVADGEHVSDLDHLFGIKGGTLRIQCRRDIGAVEVRMRSDDEDLDVSATLTPAKALEASAILWGLAMGLLDDEKGDKT